VEAIAEREGLGFQQYQVLRLLDSAGEAGLPTLTVAHRLVERAPGVTRLADKLEARGLISRVRGKDRRQVICRITADGRKLLATLDQQIDPALEGAFAALTHHEIPALVHLLNRIRNRLA
jgi:DNA-binding MarR family transcriptional regulator